MNAKEVLLKQEKPIKQIDKTIKEYDEWIKKIHILPNVFYWIILILSGGALLYFEFPAKSLAKGIIISFLINSLIKLAGREGHKEGYLDGYFSGFGGGINDVLGIDKEDQEFLEEVTIENDFLDYRESRSGKTVKVEGYDKILLFPAEATEDQIVAYLKKRFPKMLEETKEEPEEIISPESLNR